MVRMNGNTDSGIDSDSDSAVLLVVDSGHSVLTSRDNNEPQLEDREDRENGEAGQDRPSVDEDLQSFRLRLSSEEILTISLDTTSELERTCLPEFFSGLVKGKSRDSYVKIRNHFISHWRHVRPKRFGYHDLLRKVSSLHLGNVTAFSRVHKFLEAHHVINDCALDRKQWNRAQRLTRNGQKRPKRTTADTNQTKKSRTTEQKPSSVRTRPNPFKLIPLETFDSELQAPFTVRLSMEALAIVDIHAHCVRTEVIGLLGGNYDPKTQQLFILTAEPCASEVDHDLQCDMEPVSQALAKERLEQKSYHVVGWYHSHPTFVPNPSVRDLETQQNFQQLFSRASQPFVALILSPYLTCAAVEPLVSKFTCLWVSERQNAQLDYAIPYELRPKLIRREKLVFAVTNKLRELCLNIQAHPSRVNLYDKVKRVRGLDVNHLQKLCHSLGHYLVRTGLSLVECEHLLGHCRRLLAQHLTTGQ